MKEETITQRELTTLAAGGLVRAATAVAVGDQWSLVLSIGSVDRKLTAINSGNVKTWGKLDSIQNYLIRYGINEFYVNAKNYNTNNARKRKRPDSAATLRNAHKAAAFNKMVIEDGAKALEELAGGDAVLIPNEEVQKEWGIKRANLLARKGQARS